MREKPTYHKECKDCGEEYAANEVVNNECPGCGGDLD